jgi:hypothetical protein
VLCEVFASSAAIAGVATAALAVCSLAIKASEPKVMAQAMNVIPLIDVSVTIGPTNMISQ